jgi:hypothetical protein
MLGNVKSQFITDVSGQPIRPIFKGQALFLDWLILADMGDGFSRNVSKKLPFYVTQHRDRAQTSFTPR